jgi:Flp pilus assembly protein TadG
MLPIMALCFIALCGFLALAVDVGAVAIAKTQTQNAADSAALTGARSLNGSTNPNLAGAQANALAAATANPILSVAVNQADVTIAMGTYHYDTTSQTFQIQTGAPTPPDTYDLVQATVNRQVKTTFARALGISSGTVSATSVAAHRPRDVTILLDFSGSMNNESDVWNNESYLGSVNNSPNSTDPNVPQFSHYSAPSSGNIATDPWLVSTSSDPRVGKSNVTVPAIGMPAMVNDFYQHARGGTPVPAFVAQPNSYMTAPLGDLPLHVGNSNGQPYAKTVNDVNGLTTKDSKFEGTTAPNGYDYFYSKNPPPAPSGSTFQGYTVGPNYWGKTFFMWPPDPRSTMDWRRKFFFNTDGVTPLNDNTKLYSTTGDFNDPPGNYVINYKAILSWIQTTGLNPFPTRLRSGRITYYDSIPSDVPASAYTHTNANSQISDPNQRFWKEYIDWTLGVWRDPFGTVQHPGNPACSIGPDFSWGTVQVKVPPTGASAPYMDYKDNPKRPRHRFWFGPLTMLQFISDTSLNPGTIHDITTYIAKSGIAAALTDIQNNHPNDMVSMILFSRPAYNNDPPNIGAHSQAQFTLCRSYSSMIDALWFPPNSATSDVRPYDTNGLNTPRAFGDFTANTATQHALMLAYNQYSGNTSLQATGAGGFGRRGARRLVILETDGMANVNTNPAGGFSNNGANQSYYNILPGQTINSAGYDQNALLQVAQAICNNADGTPGNSPGYTSNPGYPGYSTPNKPVSIQTIAFGAIFETANSTQTTSVSLLQQIAAIGGSVFPSSASDPNDGYKWCIGTLSDRQAKLQQAFSKVMDDGISVTLVK